MSGDHEHHILMTVALAVSLGILAQVVASRFKIPAILPLLLLGIAAGTSSFGLGWVDPASMGEFLEVFIHLGVAIILLEGGLTLNLRELNKVGSSVRNLLTVGVAVTAVGAAALARWMLDIDWATAWLFGAIVTVTGPTVVAPLLRHMVAPREVKTVLLSEGLIIDPIGAVLAYLVLQWIELSGLPPQELLVEILTLVAVGSVLGFVAGSMAQWATRSRLVGEELRNLVTLALLVCGYWLSEVQAPQSGVLMAVVMGITLSGAAIPDLAPIKTFKEQLTTLLISVLFILLSAQLDVDAMVKLGWKGLVVAIGLILVVRPVAVFASVWQGNLGFKERLLLGLTGPRGIVAAAVASLAARQLDRAGLSGAATLEGLVYMVIITTCVWATLMALVLPGALGYKSDPSRRLTVLVGAHALSKLLAQRLSQKGRTAVVVDSSQQKLAALRAAGVQTVRGDARNAVTYERAGVQSDTDLLALTPNDELNVLTAELVRDEFGVEHPKVALRSPPDEFGTKRRAWIDLLGDRPIDVGRWERGLERDQVRLVDLEMDSECRTEMSDLLLDHGQQILLVCGWKGGDPSFGSVSRRMESFDSISLLVMAGGEADRRLQALEARHEEPAEGHGEEQDDGLEGALPEPTA